MQRFILPFTFLKYILFHKLIPRIVLCLQLTLPYLTLRFERLRYVLASITGK